MSIRERLQSVLWRVPVDQEVRDELAHHLELRTAELVARGVDPAEARRQARQRLGDPAAMTSTLTRLGRRRDRAFAWRHWRAELAQDVAFALRQCRRQPGFTLAAVLTLALGIGATTAIYSVVHAVVLRPFPFPDADRVLRAYTTWRGQPSGTSAGNYDYIRQRVQTFEHFAAAHGINFTLTDDGLPERIPGAQATSSYFAVFGVAPLHGRVFTADEDQPGRSHVVVLSYRLWQRRFGGDPRAVGRQLRLNGEPYDVIGIMPRAFEAAGERTELWTPEAFSPERLAMFDEQYLELYGRRRADATLAQVNGELARIAQALSIDHPRENVDRGAAAEPFAQMTVGDYRARLYVLLAAVLIVLVTACGNVANLLIARLAVRGRELAIRSAIGAGRSRIVRQVLTESLVLAGLGGAAGLAVAYGALPLLVAAAPAGVPRLTTASLDGSVVAGALALVLLTALLVGLLPALHATRGTMDADLRDGKGASVRALRPWVRQSLIAAQAAMVVIVLTGAALLILSAVKLQQVPIGFDMAGVLSARVSLPRLQYRTPEAVRGTFQDLQARLRTARGVAGVALDSQPPLLGTMGSNGLIPEGRALGMESIVLSASHFISPDYFRVLRIPLIAGRTFTDADRRSTPLVMVINETLAREAFGTADPIGKRITCCESGPEGPDTPMWKTVVGVVADVHGWGPATPPRPEFYLPINQIPDVAWTWTNNSINLLLRAESGNASALVPALRDIVRQVDPALPIFAVSTLEEGLGRTMAQARFNTGLMTLLGGSALLLAAVGIYSVIAWLVAQRTREIGLRMALGASASSIVGQMTLHGLKPVAVGMAVGLTGALVSTRVLEGQLFDTSTRDPLAIGMVITVLLMVGALASIVPAWRAASVDPSRALRDG